MLIIQELYLYETITNTPFLFEPLDGLDITMLGTSPRVIDTLVLETADFFFDFAARATLRFEVERGIDDFYLIDGEAGYTAFLQLFLYKDNILTRGAQYDLITFDRLVGRKYSVIAKIDNVFRAVFGEFVAEKTSVTNFKSNSIKFKSNLGFGYPYIVENLTVNNVIQSITCEPEFVFTGVLDEFGLPDSARSTAQLLTNTYSGPAMRVRESDGDTELDIPFLADGELDQVTLLAHCNGFDGHVVTRYDQIGSKHATQSTASKQGRIVIAGVVVLDNGKPAVELLQASLQHWAYTDSFLVGGDLAIYLVCNPTAATTMGFWGAFAATPSAIWNDTTTTFRSRFHDGANKQPVGASAAGQQITTLSLVSGDTIKSFRDSTLLQSVAFGTMTAIAAGDIGVGSQNPPSINVTTKFNGKWQEEILYKTDQTLNRAAFEQNRKDYYGIV